MTTLSVYESEPKDEQSEFVLSVKSYMDMGIEVEVYNLEENKEPFTNNEEINRLIVEKGINTLPYIYVDGLLKMVGAYPSASELGVMLGLLEDGSGCTPPTGGCGSCSCGC